MKTSELIELLQKADPSGELPVCVGNHDVYFVAVHPAYWDGCLQQLIHDKSKEPYWTITGVRFISGGQKVDITPMSAEDLIGEIPEAIVEYDGSYAESHYAARVEKWREESRALTLEVDTKA